jgi:hypothetical protein
LSNTLFNPLFSVSDIYLRWPLLVKCARGQNAMSTTSKLWLVNELVDRTANLLLLLLHYT